MPRKPVSSGKNTPTNRRWRKQFSQKLRPNNSAIKDLRFGVESAKKKNQIRMKLQQQQQHQQY